MNMNHLRSILLSTVLVALTAVSAFAQTATTQTRFAVAVTATATTVTLNSGTGVSVGSYLFSDLDLMRVTDITNTPTFTVVRGQSGTLRSAHYAQAIVWVSVPASPNTFVTVNPVGVCVASGFQYLPLINTATGQAWYCNPVTSSVSVWMSGYNASQTQPNIPRTAVVDAAYTAKLTDYLISYTSLTTNRTLTLPSASGLQGKVFIVSDEGGNVANGSILISGIVNASSTTKCCTTQYGVLRIFSNGVQWFQW